MYDYRDPCVFEQLHIFNQFNQHLFPNQYIFDSSCPQKTIVNREVTKFSKVATDEGLLLTLRKPLTNKNFYKNSIQKKVVEIKQKYLQKPKYSLVSDFFGNQYYIDNTENLQKEMIAELKAIDTNVISRKLAKESFKDYEIELSYDGDVLNVRSNGDSIDKTLKFGETIEDFYIKNCTIEDESTAVLKIGIVLKKSIAKPSQDSFAKLIDWAQASAKNEGADQKFLNGVVGCSSMNDGKRILKKKMQEERAKKEQKEKLGTAEIKKQKILAQQRIRREREAQEAQKAQEARRVQEAQKAQEAQRVQEAQEAQEAEEKSIKRERLIREQQEYQRQLVEEDRKNREARSKASRASPVQMSENEDEVSDMDVDSDSEDIAVALKKHSSPVLEDVDDAEVQRYKESVNERSPSNDAYEPILED